MLTYTLSGNEGSLYSELYQKIRVDIQSGILKKDEKMPSKRNLAKNLGVSTFTVENAYNQLICEGYLYSQLKKGYFVADLKGISKIQKPVRPVVHVNVPVKEDCYFDFSSNNAEIESFPFSIWAKLSREVLSEKQKELLKPCECGGTDELKSAIANHLFNFRGMSVAPEQIIIGAGTEYLYGLLIKLLGIDKIYGIENPGYTKLKKIYQSNNAVCCFADLDENGILVSDLRKNNVDVVHITPNHHFPTGIIVPASRRYELLAWANEKPDRYIIEDDYDSEFRQKGNPIPTMQCIDAFDKVIYMNTFSKSLAPTIRISYMVLPERLANRFYENLSFYTCTVSTFEQFTLASFINKGYFEKHINRMRLHYGRKREKTIQIFSEIFSKEQCRIIENDSGLHFIMQLQTDKLEQEIKNGLKSFNIKIRTISDYEVTENAEIKNQFILNYSNIEMEKLKEALSKLKEIAFA